VKANPRDMTAAVVGRPEFEAVTASLSGMNLGCGNTYGFGGNPCGTRDISSHRFSLFRVVFHSLVHAMCTRITDDGEADSNGNCQATHRLDLYRSKMVCE